MQVLPASLTGAATWPERPRRGPASNLAEAVPGDPRPAPNHQPLSIRGLVARVSMARHRADGGRPSDRTPDLLGFRPVEWFLVDGNRLVVSGALLAVVAVITWGAVLTGLAPLTERTPVLFLLFALVGGNFTLITIVVSISQFVLSRHLESPGEIRDRLEEIVSYRREVGKLTGQRLIPVTPTGFMLLLFRSIERDARDLEGTDWAGADEVLGTDVDELLADLAEHAGQVVELLEGGDGGIRAALFSTLNTDYSRYFYHTYRLREEYGEGLPAVAAETLTGLERHIEQVDVARRYFKTVLIQSELSTLTRLLLYIGPPVQILSVVLMLLYTAPDPELVSRPVLLVVIPFVVTAGFAPFALLTAYILRLATVVKRTAVMYPFTADPGE